MQVDNLECLGSGIVCMHFSHDTNVIVIREYTLIIRAGLCHMNNIVLTSGEFII